MRAFEDLTSRQVWNAAEYNSKVHTGSDATYMDDTVIYSSPSWVSDIAIARNSFAIFSNFSHPRPDHRL